VKKLTLLGTMATIMMFCGLSAAGEGSPPNTESNRHWLMQVGTRNMDPSRDAEFNRWYNDIDIPDVLKVAGYRRARRGQRLAAPMFPPAAPPEDLDQYVALYDIESPDIQRTMLDMLMASKKMEMTGRTTDLLKVVERVYYRQLAPGRTSARAPGSGKNHYVLLERVDCCRDEATDNQLNDWYDTQHVPDMLGIEGMVKATRYQLYRVLMVEPKSVPRFVTLYEFRGDSPQPVLNARQRLNDSLRSRGEMTELFREQGSAAYQVIRDVSSR
jgi:hypothetical protein